MRWKYASGQDRDGLKGKARKHEKLVHGCLCSSRPCSRFLVALPISLQPVLLFLSRRMNRSSGSDVPKRSSPPPTGELSLVTETDRQISKLR